MQEARSFLWLSRNIATGTGFTAGWVLLGQSVGTEANKSHSKEQENKNMLQKQYQCAWRNRGSVMHD